MSPDYVRGCLETLVKTGEVSQAYADGVLSALEKRAFVGRALWGGTKLLGKGLWGTTKFTARHPVGVGALGLGTYGGAKLLIDSPMQNLEQERDRLFAGRERGYRPSEEEAKAIDRSRHWWEYYPRWSYNWLKNRGARLVSRFDPANGRTPDSYDREWENFKAQDRADYIRQALDNDDLSNTLRLLAAAQSQNNNNEINAYWTDTKRYMTPGTRRFLGYPDRPRNTSYGPVGRAVIAGGLYKPRFDYDAPTPRRPTYGMGLPELGSTNDLYVRRGVR